MIGYVIHIEGTWYELLKDAQIASLEQKFISLVAVSLQVTSNEQHE